MRNVLEAAAEIGVGRLVYTSSYTTIGPPDEPGRLADERDIYIAGSSGDPYYETKWAMEGEAVQASQNGQPVIILCPSAVFGPGDVHMAVSGPLLMAARGRLPFYFDAPLPVIDVRDLASAHIAAAERGRIWERYILSGHNVTLHAVLSEMAAAAGVRPPRIKIGARLLRALASAGQLAPDGQASFLKTVPLWQPMSNAKAVHDLGLTTRPLSETMADTFAWFRARGVL
jgi:dihydroflavonol-4-reductase